MASSELSALLKTKFGIDPRPTGGGPQPSAAAVRVTVSVASTPSGADIEVDGAYVGSTPSELSLEPGTRQIKISKSGYKPFERTVRIDPGSRPTVAAELEGTAN